MFTKTGGTTLFFIQNFGGGSDMSEADLVWLQICYV